MTPAKTTTIILCGGTINYTHLPIGTNTSNAMIPVNGKPVIGWILNDLIDKGIKEATVVLREADTRLQNFLQRAYRGRMEIMIAALETDGGTINQSLQTGLRHTPTNGLVRIILGDTLIRDPYPDNGEDFVYVGDVEESRRWCIAFTDSQGRIVNLVDKQELHTSEPLRALAGYYHLTRGDVLAACVDEAVAAGERELSRSLLRYNARAPIYARAAQEWFDFGNIDHLVDARRRLLQPRHFNALTINPVLNTITKVSENDAKLTDELDWYLAIPDDLKVLTPRIVHHERVDGRLRFVQEYYGYPTLAELWVYGDLHADTWVSILKQVLRIHQEFKRYSGDLPPSDVLTMYADKTWERVEKLRASSAYWASLLERETLVVNGRRLKNLPLLRANIQAAAERLAQTAPIHILHGDYCFSNILFDLNNQIIRLIDPRGSFGRKGIYGDGRYDIAKLRHSVRGLYDFITADMFDVQETDGIFTTAIYANGTPETVGAAFDHLLINAGYALNDIKLIEGLLFLSMPPLHQDKFARQQMMYMTGIGLLNEVL